MLDHASATTVKSQGYQADRVFRRHTSSSSTSPSSPRSGAKRSRVCTSWASSSARRTSSSSARPNLAEPTYARPLSAQATIASRQNASLVPGLTSLTSISGRIGMAYTPTRHCDVHDLEDKGWFTDRLPLRQVSYSLNYTFLHVFFEMLSLPFSCRGGTPG